MLQILRVKNFVLIDELELSFDDGFNVITGETGTGKSILLDAISLILGARAETSLIRAGEEEATVEALFDISNNEALLTRVQQKGLVTDEYGSNELLIKRVINKNGRGRVFINGEMATLGQLIDISENLVDLCSQHEHQSLVKSTYQLELLDRYAGLTKSSKDLAEIYSALKSKSQELQSLVDHNSDIEKRKDYIQFQLNELESIGLVAGEEQSLIAERKTLSSINQLKESAYSTLSAIGGDGSAQADQMSVKDLIATALKRISKHIELDERLVGIHACLMRAALEIDEAASALNQYCSKLDFDPDRLNDIENRLTTIAQIKRKYGADSSELFNISAQLKNELLELENRSIKAERIRSEIKEIENLYLLKAKELSNKRKNAAVTLEKSIQAELDELMMGGTAFSVSFQSRTEHEHWTTTGIDRIEFLFAPNRGEGMKALGKMASGGELSRMMLAIRRVVSGQGGICVYLFDEIDAGIGGETATVVGKKIKSVASNNQVICITHLAQIASFAKAHFKVNKVTVKGRTKSHVEKIGNISQRIEEIARMAGGNKVGPKSKDYAKELLAKSLNS
jgi:DNA repair protein RecN (Recombination protein N)